MDWKNSLSELLKGVSFYISRYGPDPYLKTIEILRPYICTTYKNGFDVEVCIKAESVILPEEPVIPENLTA